MQNKIDPISFYFQMKPGLEAKIKLSKVKVNLMPALDVDFAPLFSEITPKDTPRPEEKGRGDMENHWVRLQFQYRNQPKIVALHMLLISYLRRDTKYTQHAWSLFSRLWDEHGEALLEIIRTRDLISAFRCFADHSEDIGQRMRAKMAFTYAHMIKIYESERVVEDRDLENASYTLPTGSPKIGLQNTSGVHFGGDNSLQIVNMLLAEEITEDTVLGPMILHLLHQIFEGKTVFSRFDERRIEQGLHNDSSNEWSFGFNPKTKMNETII